MIGSTSTGTLAIHRPASIDSIQVPDRDTVSSMVKTTSMKRAGEPKVDLEQLIARQRGLVTRAQSLAAGLDDDWIHRAIKDSRWQRVLPGLYATFTGILTLEQRRLAATLYVRGQAQISGLAALVWHGFRHLPDDDRIHLLVPHRTQRSSHSFVRIQRTHRLDPQPHDATRYVVCSVARAVSDACRSMNDLQTVRAIVAEAVQRKRTTVAALEQELDLAVRSRTRLLRLALREVSTGLRSAPEIELKDLLKGSVVSTSIVWNPRLVTADGAALPSPDGWIGEAGIAIEVDSREYHLGPEPWQQTMRRHNALGAHGVLVLHFTPSEIRSRRRHVRGIIEQAYHQRLSESVALGVRSVHPLAEEGGPPNA